MAEPRPTVEPTHPGTVASAVLVGAGLSWVTWQFVLFTGRSLPALGPIVWLPILALALLIGWLAFVTRGAVRNGREPLEPATALPRLQLGKTSVLAGAGLAAAYVVLALVASGGLPAPLAQGRVGHATVAAFLCVVWAVAGLALESACRIPDDQDGDSTDRFGDAE